MDEIKTEKMKKDDKTKKMLFISIGIVFFLLLVGGIAFLIVDAKNAERHNAMVLAKEYAEQNEYQRALDILDALLLKNPGDKEVRELKDKILEEKKAYEEDLRKKELDELARQQERLNSSLSQLSQSLSQNANNQAESLADKQRQAEEEARRRAEEEKRKEEERLAKLSEEERKKEEMIKALIKEGTEALEEQQYVAARQKFSDVLGIDLQDSIKESEHHATALAYTAESFYEEGDVKGAVEKAQEAIDTNKNVWQSYYVLGKIYSDNKNYESAEEQFKKALALNPQSAESLYELGKVQYMMGLSKQRSNPTLSKQKFNDARLSFSRCLEIMPSWINAHYNLALTYEKLSDRAMAKKEFLSVIALDPQNTGALLKLGEYLRDEGKYKESETYYKRIIAYSPDEYRALRGLGLTYYYAGDPVNAEKMLKKAISTEKGADDTVSFYNLALVLIEQDKSQDALTYAQKAVEKSPKVPEYQYTLGLAAYNIKAYSVAEAAFNNAIELNPSYVKPRIQLGIMYQDKGDYDKALSYLLDAYKIEPKSFEVNNNLGNLYARKKLYSESIKHYKAAIEANPADTLVRYNLALAHMDAKDLDSAAQVLEDLIKIDSTYWDAYYQLGKILISLGEKDGAKKILSTLLTKKPDYDKKAEIESLLSGL
ncbi:tetratricopeptide repeat protein [Spirochaetia bacterium 38H-sp]|uniref:Tetratricopeptide repeat protein n=1 Tax=Rarispira pelagica TaxID=3141764 RepID=A0ABU9UBG9_9SPIR